MDPATIIIICVVVIVVGWLAVRFGGNRYDW